MSNPTLMPIPQNFRKMLIGFWVHTQMPVLLSLTVFRRMLYKTALAHVKALITGKIGTVIFP